MKDYYDIIIVGAGPAGLRAAEVLKDSSFDILVLEKKPVIGPKICAAGLTRKSLELMDIPDYLFEKSINKSALRASKVSHFGELPEPVVFMINRQEFGQWQLSKLSNAENITVETSAQVTRIEDGKLEINRKKTVRYKFLIGADGPTSIVRRYLKIPVKKVLASLQYKVPLNDEIDHDRVQIILNSKYFFNGYAWIFPHKNHFDVGCSANPKLVPINKLKKGFHSWLKENNIDITNAQYESFPINYDYRGYKFGNVYLIGEAAGLASGLTGEGIYQALLSGTEVANMILNPDHPANEMDKVLKYNRIQNKIVILFKLLGPVRNAVFNRLIKIIIRRGKKNNLANKFS